MEIEPGSSTIPFILIKKTEETNITDYMRKTP